MLEECFRIFSYKKSTFGGVEEFSAATIDFLRRTKLVKFYQSAYQLRWLIVAIPNSPVQPNSYITVRFGKDI